MAANDYQPVLFSKPQSVVTNYSSNNPWAGKDEQSAMQWESFVNKGWQPQTSDTQKQAGINKMAGQVSQGADFTPYLNQLQALLKDPSKVAETPGYKFALEQGNQQVMRNAAARGMLGSGNVLAELQSRGQNLASQQYGTETNRLLDLIRGAQNFGVSSGYYQPQQPTQGRWVGGAFMQPNPMQASYF